MAWRRIWTKATPLDRLYALVGTTAVTRENFINAARARHGLGKGESCPICQGYGWINDETFGAIWCFCYLTDWYKGWMKLLAPYRSPMRDWTTLDSFEINPKKPGGKSLTEALVEADEFAKDPTQHWLILSGGYGCGKSHLLEAIARELGKIALYVAAQDLSGLVSAGISDHTLEVTLDTIEHAPILLLDDYGAEHMKTEGQDFLATVLGRIINRRYMAYREYPTVVATNIPADYLKQRDGRVGSRLLDARQSVIIQIDAPDFRLQR